MIAGVVDGDASIGLVFEVSCEEALGPGLEWAVKWEDDDVLAFVSGY